MKKLFEIGFLVALIVFMVLTAGCRTTLSSTTNTLDPTTQAMTSTTVTNYTESNLAHKSIASGGAVTAMRVITSADPESGSFMPTFILGFGTFFVFDIPSNVSAYFQDIQKSMWTAEVGSETTLLIIGTGDSNTKVTLSNPELIINIPGVKVFSPVSDNAALTVSNDKAAATVSLPRATVKMPAMPAMPAAPAPVNAPASK